VNAARYFTFADRVEAACWSNLAAALEAIHRLFDCRNAASES
jgi:hypothetical protein